jgi:hypothetical protein
VSGVQTRLLDSVLLSGVDRTENGLEEPRDSGDEPGDAMPGRNRATVSRAEIGVVAME